MQNKVISMMVVSLVAACSGPESTSSSSSSSSGAGASSSSGANGSSTTGATSAGTGSSTTGATSMGTGSSTTGATSTGATSTGTNSGSAPASTGTSASSAANGSSAALASSLAASAGGSSASVGASSSVSSTSGQGASSGNTASSTGGGNTSNAASQTGSSSATGASSLSSASSAAPSSSADALKDTLEREAHAKCAFDERCALLQGRHYITQAACDADVAPSVDATLTDRRAHLMLGAAAAVDGCIESLYPAQGSCTPTPAPSCSEAFINTNYLADGADCGPTFPGECGPSSTCQFLQNPSCGKCAPTNPVALNGACGLANGLPCVPEAWCGPNNTCVPKKTKDFACDSDRECLGYLVCALNGAGMSRCMETSGAGQSCQTLPCQAGTICGGDTSAPTCVPTNLGAACTREYVTSCLGSVCLFATPTAATGRCAYPRPISAGDACAYGQQGPECAPGLWTDMTFDNQMNQTGCTCKPIKAPGVQCNDPRECALDCVNGLCSMTLPDGEFCYGNHECQSGFCGFGNQGQVCMPANLCN